MKRVLDCGSSKAPRGSRRAHPFGVTRNAGCRKCGITCDGLPSTGQEKSTRERQEAPAGETDKKRALDTSLDISAR